MFCLINKKDGFVRMACKEKAIVDESKFYWEEINDNDFEGYSMKYKDGKLEKTKIISPDEKKKDLKDRLEKATSMNEIKNIIKDIL